MPREHNNRPRKSPAGKPSPLEGFNEHGEATPAHGADGGGLDLRAGQHKQALGRSPRDAPSPVNETMSRYKKSQAQKFSEHTPEARNAVVLPSDTLPADAVQPNPVIQGSATAFDEPVSFGESKQRRGKKPRKPDKPKPVATDGVPIAEHRPNHPQHPIHPIRPQNDTSFEVSAHDAGQSVHPHRQAPSVLDADNPTPAVDSHVDEHPRPAGKRPSETSDTGATKNSPLSHERPSPLKQERERLSHKRTTTAPSVPVSSKSRKPNYRNGMTFKPTMPAGEHQNAQNTGFDTSSKSSQLVHDTHDAVVAVPAVTPMSDYEALPTDSIDHSSSTLVDSVGKDRDFERNPAPAVETKPTAKTHAKKVAKGKPHDPPPSTTGSTPRADVASVGGVAGAGISASAPRADATPIESVTHFDSINAANDMPQTHTAPVHGDTPVGADNTTASLDISEGDRDPSKTDKTTETSDKTSVGDTGGVPRDTNDGGGKKKGSKLKFDDTADSQGSSSGSPKPSDSSDSVKPSASTKSGKQLEKAERKVERSSKKLQTAKEKLPTKRKLRTNKEFDAEKGKMKPRLRFEEEVKTQREHLRGPIITRPFKTGANMAIGFAHTKVFQVQEENVGVKAAHKGEMLAEGGLRTAYRHHKLAPYRKVQKLEEKTRKLSVKAAYRKALHDNPELRKKPLARLMQKRRIKREYAKAARDAKRAGTQVGSAIKKTSNIVQKLTTTVVKAVKSNPKFLAVLGLAFLMIIMIFGLVSSCASVASSVGQSFAAIAYIAEDEDIDDASVLYSYLEADLRMQILNLEDDWPDINEFRLDIGTIGHCPFMLMAYLTAVYHDFTFSDVEAVLHEIFAQQYHLEITEEVEERRRWEQVGWEPDVYDWVYYDWHILNVTLTAQPFATVINARMDAGQQQHHALLMQSRGLRQIVLSPFDFYWMPFVSSHYGWRIHPITGNKQLHMGIDVGLPTGTPILAATSGTVTFAGDMGGFGLVVFIDDGDGIVTVYAHCDTILVSTGQTVEAGDVIATVGSTGDSTGPHLHFEIIKNGRHLNPAIFAFSNTF